MQDSAAVTAQPPTSRPAVAVTGSSAKRARPGRTNRWLRRGLLGALALGLLALLVVALLPKPMGVDLATAERGALRVTVDEDGVARVKDRYVVSAPLNGSLERVALQAGDRVERGDALVRLVPLTPALLDARTRSSAEARLAGALAAQQQARALVERARAQEDFIGKDVERRRGLIAKGVFALETMDETDLALRTAQAEQSSAMFGAQVADHEVVMARAALGRLAAKHTGLVEEQLVVTSPVPGRVLRVLHQSEGVVQAGTPLLELGDPSALEIVVDVLTSDAVHVRPGAAARIVEWGGPALDARVRMVEPSAFTRLSALGVEEQRVNVALDLVGPPDAWAALGDGYRVSAQVITREKADALTVPSSAVFRHDGQWALFRAQDDRAELVLVELGLRTQRLVEVVRGVAEGDRVVVHPSDRLRDGARVSRR